MSSAEALARAISDPNVQASALAELAEAVARFGDIDRARALADRAEALARAISDPDLQGSALAALAKAVASTRDHDRAEALAGAIAKPAW